MKEKIKFAEFIEIEKKLEIKSGKVISVESIPKSDKLIKLSVEFGDNIEIVVTNIKKEIPDINFLLQKTFLFITNLDPVKMMGIESSAMILPGDISNMTTVNCVSGTKIL
jgi:methionyl-tRNA synthetase